MKCNVSSENTVHHGGKGRKCCHDTFPLSSAPLHASTVEEFVCGRSESLLVVWSSKLPFHHVLPLPSPGNGSLGGATSSVPSSDQLGRQPFLCVGSVLLVFGGESINCSLPFRCEWLLACVMDGYLVASGVIGYHESLQRFCPVIYGIWDGSQSTEGSTYIIKGRPCTPHIIFLPLPPKDDLMSHPIKVRNMDKAMHWSGPSALAIIWAKRQKSSKLQ